MTVTERHVIPDGDLIEHDTHHDDCPCGPAVEPILDDDGIGGWLYIHHSLDGREAKEQP